MRLNDIYKRCATGSTSHMGPPVSMQNLHLIDDANLPTFFIPSTQSSPGVQPPSNYFFFQP